MTTLTQRQRLLTVSSPLGEDVLLLTGFTGREEISRLFKFQLDLLSENEAIDPADIVGRPITWAVHHVEEDPRYFHGHVSRFAAADTTARGHRCYRAEVVPWLWFLTRSADCRIFQNKSADRIIRMVFDDLGFSSYEMNLARQPRVREYCVQYRETAFNFVSRLMEEEGIFYFFKHAEGKHTLLLADAKTSLPPCALDQVEYLSGTLSPNHISTWEHQYAFRSGRWTQTDYNFETPGTNLKTTTDTLVELPNNDNYEFFDYPGLYGSSAEGNPLTKLRMEEEETTYDVVTGASTCCDFSPGLRFRLTRHECEEEKQAYALTSVQHSASDLSFENNSPTAFYRNTFTCIPATVQFRPARVTPKPFVQGPQTAMVVGPQGQEIYTDKYGRIKVQFFWDRQGKRDENSSVWMRVAQISAGKRWGASFWPRIGQEVVVDFLEGDPDRPLITGSVYNATQMPPYQGNGLDPKHLHDNKVSGIKTCSTPGGEGFNEIRFDDTKGKEQLFLRAENTMDVRVGGDQHVSVGHERHLIVKADCFQEFKAAKLTKITGDEETSIDGDQMLAVGNDRDIEVIGTQKEKFENLETTADKINIKADASFHVDSEGTINLGSDRHTTATKEYLATGIKGVLDFDELCLTCGASYIVLNAQGIWINGPFVNINTGGSPFSVPQVQDPDAVAPAQPSKFDAVAADESRSGFPSAADARPVPARNGAAPSQNGNGKP